MLSPNTTSDISRPSILKSDTPFPWPLVDMAEFEFGTFGVENEVDMKSVYLFIY